MGRHGGNGMEGASPPPPNLMETRDRPPPGPRLPGPTSLSGQHAPLPPVSAPPPPMTHHSVWAARPPFSGECPPSSNDTPLCLGSMPPFLW